MFHAGRSAPALAAALLMLTLPAAGARADDDTDLRDTVERQARRIEELEQRLGALEGREPDGDGIEAAVDRYLARREADGRAVEPGSGERPLDDRFRFGGYMSVLYRSSDAPGTYPSFEGYRVVPQFAFDVSPGIEIASEIEFERGGADAGFLAGNEILVEYAEARFHVDETFVPKAGILLIPFLRYNLYHDDPIWNLQERPTTATRVFKAAFQQPGVGAEGVFALEDGSSFNYNAVLSNGPDDQVTNSSWSGARQDFRSDNNHNKAVWARLGAAPRVSFLDAADVGVSFATGRMDAKQRVTMTGVGVDGKLSVDRFDVIFEYARFDYDRPRSQPAALFPGGAEGGFVQVDTHLLRGLPESESGITGPDSTLTLALRWEWNDLNRRVTGASLEDDARALTLGLAFRPTQKTVIRVEHREERSSFNGFHAGEGGTWIVSLSTYF